jgi:uncharacterized protein YdbL (DUF1318 family)
MMKNNALLFILITAVTVSMFCGCTISQPKIELTGEKSVIERQVIGDYRELEKDAWIVSSVKTSVQRQAGERYEVPEDEDLYRALKMREYNKDRLRDYKNDGAVGEGIDGYIKYISNDKYDASPSMKKVVSNIIGDENNARKTIFTKTVTASGKNTEKSEIDAVAGKFARQQRDLALQNDYIEIETDKWVRKK